MSSSQINYFFTNDDIRLIENQLDKFDLLIVPYELPTNKLSFIDSIFSKNNHSGNRRVHLIHKNNTDKIELEHYPANEYVDYDRYLMDFLAPVIEFSACYISEEEKYINRSRIYYKKGFWNDKKEWELQPEDFLTSADKLFKWIKRNIKRVKIEELKGSYVSENTKKMVDEGWRLKYNNTFYPKIIENAQPVKIHKNNINTYKSSNFADAV